MEKKVTISAGVCEKWKRKFHITHHPPPRSANDTHKLKMNTLKNILFSYLSLSLTHQNSIFSNVHHPNMHDEHTSRTDVFEWNEWVFLYAMTTWNNHHMKVNWVRDINLVEEEEIIDYEWEKRICLIILHRSSLKLTLYWEIFLFSLLQKKKKSLERIFLCVWIEREINSQWHFSDSL